MKKILLVIFLITMAVFINISPALAQDAGLFSGMEKCRATGDCQINDFILLAVNVSKWILGIIGSLALLMFIYGGIKFIISQGSPESITQSKEIIKNAIIGLVLVFTAYTIIQFVLSALGLGATQNNWFSIGG